MESTSKFLKWDIIEKETGWVYSKLIDDVVITSRVRIARNLKGYPFPHNMTLETSKKIEEILIKFFLKLPYEKIFVINISSLNEKQKNSLIKKHIISKEFSENELCSKIIIIPEKKTSIMINEEDHLRIQVIFPGFNLKKCLKVIDEIDDYIDKELDYAFSPNFGYLTACPTNTGTGLRSSVLIHIPGIRFFKKDKIIFKNIQSIGITIRGFYGEGSLPFGSMFQISSTETTGKTENEIIEELESVIKLIIEEEKNCVEKIKKDKNLKKKIGEKIMKILKPEKTNGQFTDLYSLLSLSYVCGILDIEKKELRNLFFYLLENIEKNKNYIFNGKNGKILKREIWERLNV
ncbi:MAG: ATP--guanido phosphotransferase [Candidatus Omnitrophica bacterium]|nr:ATP--guanido phosphotransferase [Candidatus Omnitrophota bacterium]MCM8802744.1 ATP--guanido phosphotransferase [Candidatus Omnitrophota bacterium]